MWICLPVYTLTCFCIHVHNIMTSYHSILAFSITISRISRVLLMQDYVEPDVYPGARGLSSKPIQSNFKYNNLNQWLWPTRHGELDSRGKTSTDTKFSNPKVQVQQLESVAMTHSTWWAWFSRKDVHRCRGLQSKSKVQPLTFFLCLPQEILENMHPHIMHCILTIFPFSGFLTLDRKSVV